MLGLIVSVVPDYSFLGFEACLFTGLVLGLTNGALIAFLRLPPFIVTLGSLTAVRGVARLFSNDWTVFNSDLPFAFIGNQTLGGTSFVGGTGSIWGTLVGALIIAVLSNGLILTGVSDIWQYIIKGLVIIGAVTLDRYRLAKTARS
jgi:predicted ABC-type sugar transport system permease subunit